MEVPVILFDNNRYRLNKAIFAYSSGAKYLVNIGKNSIGIELLMKVVIKYPPCFLPTLIKLFQLVLSLFITRYHQGTDVNINK